MEERERPNSGFHNEQKEESWRAIGEGELLDEVFVRFWIRELMARI